MHTKDLSPHRSGLSQVKLFFALSRTPHGLLDMATPAFAALLWYGSFPPLRIVILGMMTAFAGYTAVYALNDLVDHRIDRMRVDKGLLPEAQNDLDGIFVRHPVAQGLLPFTHALLWAALWALLALVGAYSLSPVCAAIFLGGCLLEVLYCLLWKSSYLKILLSGAVKTSGAMAAVFAVDPRPAPFPLLLLFLWLFFWEIGGQNIPNDWADIEEDHALRATTIPVKFGPSCANTIIMLTLLVAVALGGVLLGRTPAGTRFTGIASSLAAGLYLLLLPAYRLYRTNGRMQALALFNSASYYPLVLLAVVIITIIL